MDEKTQTADIDSRLKTERDALRAFVALLEAEQHALIDGQTEQLLALSDNKIQAVHELGKLANARKEGLLSQGAGTGAGDIARWLQMHAVSSLPVWKDIQQFAEQVQYLNRINGTLIQTRLRQNQQALTALHTAANSAHGLYGADGQPHLPSSGRILGSV